MSFSSLGHNFAPYVDPDYRKTEKTLAAEIPYRTKAVHQFDIGCYYRANIKDPRKPIYTQHGLANYATVKLGDDRLRYDRSFTHEVFRPHITRGDENAGWSEEHILANRRRDYQYCKQQWGGSLDHVCEEVLGAIKLKLTIRTKIGLYELIETFKHFTEDGKEAITFPQMRMVFEMMGFSFSENQVLALFAKYDPEMKGELSYKEFIERLGEGDVEGFHRPWLRRKGQPIKLPPGVKPTLASGAGDVIDLEQRRHELKQVFDFIDKSKEGRLADEELTLLLTVIGADLMGDGLETHLKVLSSSTPEGFSGVDFETFWAWWLILPTY